MKPTAGRIAPRSAALAPAAMDAFVRKQTLKMFLAFTLMFAAGVKVCDALFFRGETLAAVAEETEEQFWRANARPQALQPEVRPCVRPARRGELCPSFVLRRLGRDEHVPKSAAEDLRRFRAWRERFNGQPDL